MILRIDDMIAARNALNSSGPDESGNDARECLQWVECLEVWVECHL